VGSADASTNTTASWSASSGGASGASIPGTSDTAIWDGGGNTNAIIDGATLNVANIWIKSTYTHTVTQNIAVIIAGNFTDSGSDTASWATGTSGTITFTGSNIDTILSCTGTLPGTVVITKGTWDRAFTLGSGCTINLGASPTSSSAAYYYSSILTNNGTIVIASGTWTVNFYFLQNNGTITHNGTGLTTIGAFTNVGTTTFSSGTTFTVANNLVNSGTIIYGGSAMTIGGNLNVTTGTFDTTGKTITFTGTNADTTLSCTGTLPGTVVINKGTWDRAFTLGSGCTINLGASPTSNFAIYNGGSILTNNGTIVIASGTWTVTGGSLTNNGTITHNGTGLSIARNFTNTGTTTASSLTTFSVSLAFSNTRSITLGASTASTFTTSFSNTGTITGISTMTVGTSFSNTGTIINSSNVSVGTTFANSGTWDLTNKTVTFNTAGASTITGNMSGANLVLNKSGAANTLGLPATLTVNNFTHTLGTLSNTATVLTINGNLAVTPAAATYFGGANMSLVFASTSDQTISITSGTIPESLEINKLSGKVTLSTNVTNAASKACTVTAGTLFLNGKSFTCGGTFSVASGAELQLIGSESTITTPTLATNSTVTYVGDGDSAADTFGIKDFSYSNLTINSIDSGDSFSSSLSVISLSKQNNASYVLDKGVAGKFDVTHVSYSTVLKEEGTYKMWYTGHNGTSWAGIGYATSPDGINWTKQNSGNAVLTVTAGKFDSGGVISPTIINDNGTYKMWYAGYNGTYWDGIGYATSPDGIAWTKQNSGNAVVPQGSNPSFDYPHIYMPNVIKDGDIYKMWYSGNNGSVVTTGYATSLDGITWTKYVNNPVMTNSAGKFDSTNVYTPNVVYDGTKYIMFYSGYNGTTWKWDGIGYATSPDGITWTKQNSGNALITNGVNPAFDYNAMYSNATIIDNNQYMVWYSGQDSTNIRIGLATTSSLVTSLNTNIANNFSILAGLLGDSTSLNLLGTDQTISLNASTTIGTLTKISTISADTLTFGTTGELIITGTTTLQGTTTYSLTIESSSSGTPWYFNPQGIRDFADFIVSDSYYTAYDATTTIDTTLMTNILDGGGNTGWTFGAGASAVVTVVKSGTQIATTTIPTTTENLGGGFLLTSTEGDATVNSIRLKQIGSLATTTFDNIDLVFKDAVEGVCSTTTPDGTSPFGTAGSFDENNIATTTGTIELTADTPVCLYINYDLLGEYSTSTLGRSIDFEITNPSTDVIIEGGTVSTNSQVNITGRTMVTTDDILSMLSLHMPNADKDPTVFYLQNDAVWKTVAGGTPIRLTNANLKVHELTFTDLTGANSGGTVKMSITVSNVDQGADPSFLNVTRTYSTTASVKAWSGND